MCVYHGLAGAEHATPHDGGPGTTHVITAGDHHHRQAAGLDRESGENKYSGLKGCVYRYVTADTHLNGTLQTSDLKICHKID